MIIFLIISTTLIGNFPTDVSALNITASAPSITAFATSFTSALVGVLLIIILSIIWVAIITGFPIWIHFCTIIFCKSGTLSIGSSTPKSPLATIIPSAKSIILSISSIASGFSIFAIIRAFLFLLYIRSFNVIISDPLLTKDKPIQSKSCSRAKSKSLMSFGVRQGNDIFVFGKLRPFFEVKWPPMVIKHFTWSLKFVSNTFNCNFPSSIKTVSPTFTSLGNWG